MIKNIFQLQKTARRIQKRLNGTQLKLFRDDGSKLSSKQRERLQAFQGHLERAARILRVTLYQRNIGGLCNRCAFPKKQQRQLGLLPQVN